MLKVLKSTLYLLLVVFIFAACFFAYRWYQSRTEIHTERNATVLLERMQKVMKLTTVEAHFSELFERKSFRYFDISPFQKKVLVRVKAKVAAGYDYEGLKIDVDSTNKTIWINQLPEPQILYIDHDLDYYDISEGLFTSFSAAEYNQIQNEAKNLIKQKANESQLLAQAKEQSSDLIGLLNSIAIASGWELKVRSRPALN